MPKLRDLAKTDAAISRNGDHRNFASIFPNTVSNLSHNATTDKRASTNANLSLGTEQSLLEDKGPISLEQVLLIERMI